MDNEEDCGHVIRVGDPGRHCNNDNVRDDFHQDSENAGGDHMADTASLKEILFRHSAEQCKVCEAIPFDQIGHQIEYEKFKMLHEVIEVADLEEEFGYFLKSFEKKADLKSLSLISRRCQVVGRTFRKR